MELVATQFVVSRMMGMEAVMIVAQYPMCVLYLGNCSRDRVSYWYLVTKTDWVQGY